MGDVPNGAAGQSGGKALSRSKPTRAVPSSPCRRPAAWQPGARRGAHGTVGERLDLNPGTAVIGSNRDPKEDLRRARAAKRSADAAVRKLERDGRRAGAIIEDAERILHELEHQACVLPRLRNWFAGNSKARMPETNGAFGKPMHWRVYGAPNYCVRRRGIVPVPVEIGAAGAIG